MEDIPENWLHRDMGLAIKNLGGLYYTSEFYDVPFVTMNRVGTSREKHTVQIL